jgi:hypothetical protein
LLIGNNKFTFNSGSYVEFYQRFSGHESGEIKTGILSKNSTFKIGPSSITFKKNSKIYFSLDGNIEGGCLLNDEIFTVRGKKIKFKSGTNVRFHDNGILHWGKLPQNTEFILGKNKIIFLGGSNIQFYDTGEVWSGVLLKDTKILTDDSRGNLNKMLWKKGDRVFFTENGIAFFTD